jgi:hypothetical protein
MGQRTTRLGPGISISHLQEVLPVAAGRVQHSLHPKDVRPVWLPVPQQGLRPSPQPAARAT